MKSMGSIVKNKYHSYYITLLREEVPIDLDLNLQYSLNIYLY